MNTTHLGLYRPNITDEVGVASSLTDNFDKIDLFAKGTVNVLSFGAKGDGVTDDTVAFNNAISFMTSGGTLVIPPGTYMIQGIGGANDYPTGGIKLKSNITVWMPGATLKVIPNSSANYTCVNITDCDNVTLYGGTVQGERANHTPSPTFASMGDQWGYGIAVVGSRNIHIENVIVKDCQGDGIYIGHRSAAGTESTDVTVKDCVVDNNGRNGMSLTGLIRGVMEGNVFKNTIGTSPECGVDIEPNPGRIVEYVELKSNQFLNNKQHGLLFGSIEEGTPSGKYCKVSGNTAKGNTLSGYYTNRADYNHFEDNLAIENKNNGFVFLQSKHNTINDNRAIKNDFHGFMIGESSDSNEITNNVAKGNSQATTNLYDQFNVWTSLKNTMQGNVGRHLGLTKKARYGLYITSTCANTFAQNNDLYESSTAAGGFNNASTTTNKGAGNRGNDGTFNTNDFI